MMLNTFLFDLDGTLIDSPKIIIEGFIDALEKHVPNYVLTEKDKTNILGQTLEKAFEKYKTDEGHYNLLAKTFRETTKIKILNELKAYDYAYEILTYLKSKGFKIGIVTSKVGYAVDESLMSSKLEGLFDVIISFEDTENHKPNPEPILKAINMLNSKISETIYIGDHENDIKAGKNAGVKTALVGFSYRFDEGKKENPNYIFNDLKEIKDIF